MKIGIDLTPLQGPHRMRGVGSVIINFLNNLPEHSKGKDQYIFFIYENNKEDLGKIINLSGVNYEFKTINKSPDMLLTKILKSFNVRIGNMIQNNFGKIGEWYMGDSRIRSRQDIDIFLQFDQNVSLPHKKYCRSALVLYDLIPYIFESDYLWTYNTARRNGCSIKGAIRRSWLRYCYVGTLRHNTKTAVELYAISECTKNDFARLLKVAPDKITVTLLGVNQIKALDVAKSIKLKRYYETDWGDLTKDVVIDSSYKFLFFAGGLDPRRKLVDLVAAYNNLRGQGYDIKLILAGDTMLGPTTVPSLDLQRYLKNTSYIDDVYFVGFIDEDQKNWLYQNALAFVYPSVYEGFGLPVLEAMNYGTPVITYKNSSISEIAGDAALYANSFLDIVDQTKKLLDNPKLVEKYSKLGKKQAAKFLWEETTQKILSSVSQM